MLIFLMLILTGSTVHCLTCDELMDMSEEKKMTIQEIKTMTPKHINDCLSYVAKDPLNTADAEFIWKTLINYYEGIANIPDDILAQLRWVTVVITAEEYANITISTIEIVENFGFPYNLDKSQLEAVAERVREDFAGKTPEDYTLYDLQALNQILCVFNRSEIERIRPKAYKEAAFFIGKLENCSSEVLLGFANLAIHKDAFGPISKWTNKILATVGIVAECFPGSFILKDFEKKERTDKGTNKEREDFLDNNKNLSKAT